VSKGTRIVIALIALASAVAFAAIPVAAPALGMNAMPLYACAGFCVLIAVACAGGATGFGALRLIAGVVFLLYAAYLVDEIRRPDRVLASGRRSQPSVLNAAFGFLILGVPCGLFAGFGGGLRKREAGQRLTAPKTFEEEVQRHRRCGEVICKVAAGSVEDPLAAAKWLDLTNSELHLNAINIERATETAVAVLVRDLAYEAELMPEAKARELVGRFLDQCGAEEPGTRFFTNVSDDFLVPGRTSWSFSSATSATFDMGILVVGPTRLGCLWVTDED
jgi:hypothetical protein